MGLLIQEYGRVMLAVLLSAIITGGVLWGFMNKWKEFGGVDDTVKTGFLADEKKRTPPLLRVQDIKITQGREPNFTDYISAVDFDGRDLMPQIKMKYREEVPGVRRYEVWVTSPITGKTTRKKLIVLVDAPVASANMRGYKGGDQFICE